MREEISSSFGARSTSASAAAPRASPLKQLAASLLMRTRWFTREIVTRRWFLHEHVAPLRLAARQPQAMMCSPAST